MAEVLSVVATVPGLAVKISMEEDDEVQIAMLYAKYSVLESLGGNNPTPVQSTLAWQIQPSDKNDFRVRVYASIDPTIEPASYGEESLSKFFKHGTYPSVDSHVAYPELAPISFLRFVQVQGVSNLIFYGPYDGVPVFSNGVRFSDYYLSF